MNLRPLWIVAIVALGAVPGGGCGGGGTPGGTTAPGSAGAPGPGDIAANNRGVGLMSRYEYGPALEIFAKLSAAHPNWTDVQVNLAIATLNRQEEGDEAEALRQLEAIVAAHPDHLRARFCLGLLLLRAGDPRALDQLEVVSEADPADAYALYHYGDALEQQDRREEALPLFQNAIKLNPSLSSAYYRVNRNLMAQRKPDEAAVWLEQFQRLKDSPRECVVKMIYSKMGPKAEALAVDAPVPAPISRPLGSFFGEAAPVLAKPAAAPAPAGGGEARAPVASGRRAAVTPVDLDGDGDLDLFIASGSAPVVLINSEGRFELDAAHMLARIGNVNAAAFGDYDNDGLTDAYLCRRGPNQLWRQTAAASGSVPGGGPGGWTDVTAATGTANGTLDTVDGIMVDADHDGDLDIFCVNADGPNELLNNNLDGSFTPIAADRGIDSGVRASRQVVASDLDGDRDVDFLVIHEQPPHEVFVNDRLWEYRKGVGFGPLLREEIIAAVAGDADADGRPEVYTLGPRGLVSRFTADAQGLWAGTPLFTPPPGTPPTTSRQLALADITGDGAPSLLFSARQSWSALSPATGELVHAADRPTLAGLTGWAPILLDVARGPAVVGVAGDAPPILWSPGDGRFPFAAFALSGKTDAGNSMRSNASGIGARLVSRAGSHWGAFDTFRSDAGPGAGLQPVAVGAAGEPQIDFVSIDWSDGVLQTEIDLAPGKLHKITESQRQTSSCPVLFAWDGTRFAFVSDLLGVGGLGYLVAPGVYAPPRPWEFFLLPEGLARPRDGRYLLKLSEPMEEACYLDMAALAAYDLPPGWSMTLDERVGPSGPEPTGAAVFYRDSLQPVAATNDRGEDALSAIAAIDGRAAPVGTLDERFIGRLKADHALTLTFAHPIDDAAHPGRRPVLIADGWIEYPYSQTMFAAWQAGADYRPPTFEARSADGTWQVVLAQFGYPAGMPRQMSVPLDGLPAGTTALRITTNQEIYWDRITVAFSEPCPDARRIDLPLVAARLARSGFAQRTTGPQRRPHYDYAKRSTFWDTRHQDGLYTREGPVDELVAVTDGALAIFGPGEEVHTEFAAPLQSPPEGWTRRLVLETRGWCKDMDLFTAEGETLEPLPGPDTPARKTLHDRYNTRHQAGP